MKDGKIKTASMERINIDVDSIAKLAIFLEGYKQGKGNLLPLGTDSLEQLWNAINFLRGDMRYRCRGFELKK